MRIREAQKHTDPTDPDPEHWFVDAVIKHFNFWFTLRLLNYAMATSRYPPPRLFTSRFSRRAKIRLGCSLSECPNELEWVRLRRARDTQQAFHITPCQDAFLGMSKLFSFLYF
jgi:hypothetical protein